jgi:hypothetical protein
VRLEGLGQLKIPMTSLGIEPTTFRLVALCLNQLRYSVIICNSILSITATLLETTEQALTSFPSYGTLKRYVDQCTVSHTTQPPPLSLYSCVGLAYSISMQITHSTPQVIIKTSPYEFLAQHFYRLFRWLTWRRS